jgi:hypothetical protein
VWRLLHFAFPARSALRSLGDRNAMRKLTLPKSLCLAKVTHHSCCTDAAWNCARITGNPEVIGPRVPGPGKYQSKS